MLGIGGASSARAQESSTVHLIEASELQLIDDAHDHGPRVFTREDMLAALEGQPLIVSRIVYCECKYDPNVVVYRRDGSPLYYGCAQLMTGRGNGYDLFQRWGYDDWRNPHQVVGFLNEVIRRGMLGSQYPRTQHGCPGSP